MTTPIDNWQPGTTSGPNALPQLNGSPNYSGPNPAADSVNPGSSIIPGFMEPVAPNATK